MHRLSFWIALITLPASAGCAAAAGRYSPQVGIASYYTNALHDPTASGARYDERALTAAHRTLPFGTRVRVTNLANHRSVVLTITDRGPYRRGRIIDVSRRASRDLGFQHQGLTRVRVVVVKGHPRRDSRLGSGTARPLETRRMKVRGPLRVGTRHYICNR